MFEDTRFADAQAATVAQIRESADPKAMAERILAVATDELSQCSYGGSMPVAEGQAVAARTFLASLKPAASFTDTAESGRDALIRRGDVVWAEGDAGISDAQIAAHLSTLPQSWTITDIRQGNLTEAFGTRPVGTPVIGYTVTTSLGFTGRHIGIGR